MARQRFEHIDILRGVVMAVMALDHVRGFFSEVNYPPTDLQQASSALFLTRWITHYCAPTFVFLSGASAFFYASREGRSKGDLARFLWTRGLWLMVLETTVVSFAWEFAIAPPYWGVIWAIGLSMVVLSALIWLPRKWLWGVALLMILGHNTLDAGGALHFVTEAAQSHPVANFLWTILHGKANLMVGETKVAYLHYALVPWVGVMTLGYVSAHALRMAEKKVLLGWGLAAIAAFALLRGLNLYGDPVPWQDTGRGAWWACLAMLNVTKYPPSLNFLLMTLGPGVIALYYCDRVKGTLRHILLAFGRVPLFYYMLHLLLIHSLSVLCRVLFSLPDDWGVGLPGVYLWWIAVLAMLYGPCKWFMGVKARRKDWWLSYL